jgi:hypothetical protein
MCCVWRQYVCQLHVYISLCDVATSCRRFTRLCLTLHINTNMARSASAFYQTNVSDCPHTMNYYLLTWQHCCVDFTVTLLQTHQMFQMFTQQLDILLQSLAIVSSSCFVCYTGNSPRQRNLTKKVCFTTMITMNCTPHTAHRTLHTAHRQLSEPNLPINTTSFLQHM